MAEYLLRILPGLLAASIYFIGVACGVYWTTK